MAKSVLQVGSFGGFGLAALKEEGKQVAFDPARNVDPFPPPGREALGMRGTLIFSQYVPGTLRDLTNAVDKLCGGHNREIPGRRDIESYSFNVALASGKNRYAQAWEEILALYEPYIAAGEVRPFIDREFIESEDALHCDITLWGWK